MAKVIIIGGGPAGCEAAHQLANQGIDVELVEKNNETGGNLNNWYQLFPDRKSAKDLNDILRRTRKANFSYLSVTVAYLKVTPY